MAEPQYPTLRWVYFEGRCRRCGMRVIVDRENNGHTRNGRWCGPVETEHPFAVPDEPPGNDWMIRRRDGSASPLDARRRD